MTGGRIARSAMMFFLLLTCVTACIDSDSGSDDGKSNTSFFGECRHEALYCCSVISDYTDEYEIITAPVVGSKELHGECRAYIDGQWWWVHMTLYGVRLDIEPLVAMELWNIMAVDDLVTFAARVEANSKGKQK